MKRSKYKKGILNSNTQKHNVQLEIDLTQPCTSTMENYLIMFDNIIMINEIPPSLCSVLENSITEAERIEKKQIYC